MSRQDHIGAWLVTPDGGRLPLQGSWTIGRAKDNGLVLRHDKISRRHALIHEQGHREYWLVDLGSSNGTYLNGRRINRPMALRDQDVVEIAHIPMTFLQLLPPDTMVGKSRGTNVTKPDVETVSCWMLVADIESFTKLSQTLSADELPVVTGRWLLQCKQVIEDQGGIINKFLGDGFFAYWKNRHDTLPGLLKALAALEQMQAETQPRFRVVVHFGPISVGGASSMGEESLLGPEVNFAFRMEKLAGSLSLPRMLSGSAYEKLRDMRPAREAGRYPVSGFEGNFAFYSF